MVAVKGLLRLRMWALVLLLAVGFGVAEAGAAEAREETPAVVNPPIRWEGSRWLSLDGTWQFTKDPDLLGEREGWYKADVALPEAMEIQVPAAWETQGIAAPGMSHTDHLRVVYEPTPRMLKSKYSGAAWYQRTFFVPQDWAGKHIWLKVGGINSQGWLWVNGKFVTLNWAYCGTYKYNVTDLMQPGVDNVIAILVRNDVPSRRGQSNCVAQYGGIFRSIELEATESMMIDDVYVTPLVEKSTAQVRVTLRKVITRSNGEFEMELRIRPLGVIGQGHAEAGEPLGYGKIHRVTANIHGEHGIWHEAIDIPIESCEFWSPEQPYLYAVEVVLKQNGKVRHGWVERFGMKQWEVRGGDFYLNGRRYYLRGAGDDHVYPLTVSSPASRQIHREHLATAKAYGFNFLRHHTHNEIPEFFQAADEVAILVQGELPYWAPGVHMSLGPIDPKQDLMELVRHYRRYTSLAQYCGGNEGDYGQFGPELYRLCKALDPTRPFLSQDGGANTRENSDLNTHGAGQQHVPGQDPTWPFVKHEYMSLGLNEDPRIDSKYKSGYLPTLTVENVKRHVEENLGLKWTWADACYTGGLKLQGIHHKIGFETARLDPQLDGAICWLMVDISPNSQNGVLDMFWGRKASTPDFFQQFNAATVILAQKTQSQSGETLTAIPEAPVYTSGEVLEIDWVVSNFDRTAVVNDQLIWQIRKEEQVLSEGTAGSVNVSTGKVEIVGRSKITIPSVRQPVKVQLTVRLAESKVNNAWDIWIFPPWQQRPLRQVAASPSVHGLLAKRYKGMQQLEERGKKARVVVAKNLQEPGVLEALEAGSRVILLELPNYNPISPGYRLGWWGTTNQTGTMVAKHAAFGSFPNEGWLEQVFWRLIGKAEKLDPGHQFKSVEPLILGIGRAGYIFQSVDNANLLPGFNLSVFQAQVGKGQLLCSGLNLQNDYPEAIYLLDEFIMYALSEKFTSKGTFDVSKFKARMAENRKIRKQVNGLSSIISQSVFTKNYPGFLGPLDIHSARQTDGKSAVTWLTKPVESKKIENGRYTFVWIAATGYRSQPSGEYFVLFLNGKEILRFNVAFESSNWIDSGGKVFLDYDVKGFTRSSDKEDTCGVMRLTIPAEWLKVGEAAELKVVGSASGSQRFFGVYHLK